MTAAVRIEMQPLQGGRSAVKIPFGRDTNGKMVSIDAVIRGLACQCFCSACDAPLVARKGETNQHHFAHYVETENCVEARETALHKFAKELICGALDLRLPDNLNLGQMQDAKSEQWLDGIRPDVLAQFDEPVAIEIRVAHPVPPEKLQKFVTRKLAALEIDLSPYRNEHKNEDNWRDLILRTAHRFWLFAPAVVRAEIERRAREEAERCELAAQRERDRIEFIKAAARREKEWHQLVAAEHAERTRKYLERCKREDQEKAEQEKAELEYQFYKGQLLAQDERAEKADGSELKYLEGLKICADTKRAFDEWERRKREAALRRNPQ